MGRDVETRAFTREDRTRHREKVRQCLDVFERMLREAKFETGKPTTGIEIELNLIDVKDDPALKNAEALAAIADPDFQTELGQLTSRSTCRPGDWRAGVSPGSRRTSGPASTRPRTRPARSAPI